MTSPRLGRAAFSVLAALAACAAQPSDTSVVQASDLVAAGATFSANEIVDLPSFTDATGITRAAIQQFLTSTPYGGASFLATYSSNGVSAIDAIMATAERYTLNPLVVVVRAEMEQGLVGSAFYPSAPERVEYVFGCGCSRGTSACDPTLAGFDLQADCLGRQLPADLDSVAASGHTAGGWGPTITMATLDNVRVTPADASTAAVYDYTPLVDDGKAGGNWLFWNLWRKYAAAVAYKGAGAIATPTAALGAACTVNGNCGFPGGVCATNFPGGLCTAACTTTCPADPSKTPAVCADFQGQGGFCLPLCNPNASACRTGYTCTSVSVFGNTSTSQNACSPP